MSVGYQYGEDTEQSAFEMDFPYELTPDQAKSMTKLKVIWNASDQWIVYYVVT